MSYCINCGTNNPKEAKFCPSCGTKTGTTPTNKFISEYKEKMYKNIVMSLKKEGQSFAEKKVKEAFSSILPNKSNISEQTQSVSEVFKPERKSIQQTQAQVTTTKKINKWTLLYVIINGLLVYLGHQSNEAVGVLLFSILTLFIVFLRRNKVKPYNWLVKIILIIQLVFLVALVVDRLEYITVITLLFISLLLTNFILLFKGNNS